MSVYYLDSQASQYSKECMRRLVFPDEDWFRLTWDIDSSRDILNKTNYICREFIQQITNISFSRMNLLHSLCRLSLIIHWFLYVKYGIELVNIHSVTVVINCHISSVNVWKSLLSWRKVWWYKRWVLNNYF